MAPLLCCLSSFRRKKKPHVPSPKVTIPSPFVLVPVRPSPTERDWAPVLEAAETHRSVNYVVVVNPNDGPGFLPLPDPRHATIVNRLASLPNICILGFVRCSLARRHPAAISEEIDLYRGWNEAVSPPLRVDGIFFDQVPSEPAAAQDLARLARYARHTWFTAVGKPGVVVYNVGAPVDGTFFDDADLVVVAEEAAAKLDELGGKGGALQDCARQHPGRTTTILHSFAGADGELEEALDRLYGWDVGGVFVTEQAVGKYDGWPKVWREVSEWAAGKRKQSAERVKHFT